MTTVSVVLPVYNGERFIAEAIRSVIEQSHSDWELIVVDDGSTDSTARVVQTFDDSRIHYAYQENRDQAAALNKGLELACGEYVTTLDADDCLTPNSLLDRVSYLEQHPEFGAVYADGYFCDSSGNAIQRFSEYCPRSAIGDVYEAFIVTCFLGTGATVMIRRDVLDQHRLRYDESIHWCADWDFYIRVAARTSYGAVDSVAVRYRIHGANMTIVLPDARRRASVIRTRLKVLESDRFETVSDAVKSAFFYCLLVDDLAGRAEQRAVTVESARFRALPADVRARLLRLMAVDSLLRRENTAIARVWFRAAWALAPLEPKTALLTLLSSVSVVATRRIVSIWRRSHRQHRVPSPFELAPRVAQSVV